MDDFAPMLAKAYDRKRLEKHFGQGGVVLGSPKLDGIRCVIRGGNVLARSLKPIPNHHIREMLSGFNYHDGEIIIGDPADPLVLSNTNSGVRSEDGEPNFTFWVFDHFEKPEDPYITRILRIQNDYPVRMLPQKMIKTLDEFDATEAEFLEQGFEGMMLRRPNAPYKFGRSTPIDMALNKVKREEDFDALIDDVFEAMENTNEAYTNELGRTARSSHAEGKVAKGMAGGFWVKHEGKPFKVSAGKLTHKEREWAWENRDKLIGKQHIKYRAFMYGIVNVPKLGRALGFRDTFDMS